MKLIWLRLQGESKNKEQADIATDIIEETKELIAKKDYPKDDILYKIKTFLSQVPLHGPSFGSSLDKNRIHLEKSEDARETKDWETAQKYLDDLNWIYQDRDIQGNTLFLTEWV